MLREVSSCVINYFKLFPKQVSDCKGSGVLWGPLRLSGPAVTNKMILADVLYTSTLLTPLITATRR